MDLISCIQRGDETSARNLVKQAVVDVDVEGPDGTTPLMQAAIYGSSTKLIETLLLAGARTDVISHKTGWTPLMYAAHYGRSRIVQLLVAREDIADTVNVKSPIDDTTALMVAAERGKYDVVWMLIEAGADTAAEDINQETAVMKAARLGHADVVRLLFTRNKSSLCGRNRKHETVTDIAKAHLQGEIYLICMDHGASVVDTYLTPAVISLSDIQKSAFKEDKQVIEYILLANEFDNYQLNIIRKDTDDFRTDITNLVLQTIGSRKQIQYMKQALDALPVEVAHLIDRSDSVRILISNKTSTSCSKKHLTEEFRLLNCHSFNKHGRPTEKSKCPCKSNMTAVFDLPDHLQSLIRQTAANCITPVSSEIYDGNGNRATVTIRYEYYMSFQMVNVQIKDSYGNIDSKRMFVLYLNKHNRPAMDTAGYLRAAFTRLIRRFGAFSDVLCRYAENIHDNEFIAKSILYAHYNIVNQRIQPRQRLVRPLETLIDNGLDFKLMHFTGNTLLETLVSWYGMSESIDSLLAILIKEYGVKIQARNVQQKNIYQVMLKNRRKCQRHIAEILAPHVTEADIRELDPLVPEDLNYCPTCMIESKLKFRLRLNSESSELVQVKKRIDSLTGSSTVDTSEYDAFINCLMNLLPDKTKHERLCCHGNYSICEAVSRFWQKSNGDILVDSRDRNPLHMYAFIDNQYLTRACAESDQIKGLLDKVHTHPEVPLLIAKPDHFGRTPLHYFVQGDFNNSLLEKILNNMSKDALSTSINKQDRFGRTVLHYAASLFERNERIDLLKQKGANESILDDFGNSPKDCKNQAKIITNRSEEYTDKIKWLNMDASGRKKLIASLGSKTQLFVLDLSKVLSKQGLCWNPFEYKLLTRILPFAYQDGRCTEIHEELFQFMERLFNKLYDLDRRFKSKVVSVGSGYEKSRIGLVDEFDFNIILVQFSKICETYLTPACPPGFVHVRKSSKIDMDSTYSEFFNDNGVLNIKELKNTFEKLVKNLLKSKSLWENEIFFEMAIVHEDLLNTYETSKCSFKIKLTVLNPMYVTISIDIVPVLHMDGYWPEGTIQELSQEFKDNRCNLVFDQPHNIHPWLPKHIPYARISFAPAESQIVRSCSMESRMAFMIAKYLNEAFVDLKQELPIKVTSHILKTTLLYCLAAEARNTKKKIVGKPVGWKNTSNEFNENEVTVWLEKLLNCFLCFHRLDYLPSFFLPSLCRPISDYEHYIRENITQLAIRCPSANIKRDNMIKHTIEAEIMSPYNTNVSYPSQSQPPISTSKLYIYTSFCSAVYSMIHIVGEEHNGWLRINQLTNQENCLLEHFNAAALFSHLNGQHVMKWFRVMDASEEVPAARLICSLKSTPPPPSYSRPCGYFCSKPTESVGLHSELEQFTTILGGIRRGSGQSERFGGSKFSSYPGNSFGRSRSKYRRTQPINEFPPLIIPLNFTGQSVPAGPPNVMQFNIPTNHMPHGVPADFGEILGNISFGIPAGHQSPSPQDQAASRYEQSLNATTLSQHQYGQEESRGFRPQFTASRHPTAEQFSSEPLQVGMNNSSIRASRPLDPSDVISQFNAPSHSASDLLTAEEIAYYEKQFEMLENPK